MNWWITGLAGIVVLGMMAGCTRTAGYAGVPGKPTLTATIGPTATENPTPAATATPQVTAIPEGCGETSGRIERIKLPSEILAGGLWVTVYTPPCFDGDGGTLYSVLYLLHGQNMDDNYWIQLGAAAIADKAILAGQAPFLMVMPYEERNFDPPGSSNFDDAVVQELIPWVDATYPVCTERACRAIGGISRGGGWAVHIALRNFNTFGSVGAHSMGLMAGDWWYVSHLLETYKPAEFPRFYVDRGEQDYLAKDIDLFERTLANGSIPHEFVISPLGHENAYWQAHVGDYMDWYMQGLPQAD